MFPKVLRVSITDSRVSVRAPRIINHVTGIFFLFRRFAVLRISSRLKSLARVSRTSSHADSAPISTSLKPAFFIRSRSSSSTAPGLSPIVWSLRSRFFKMSSRNTFFVCSRGTLKVLSVNSIWFTPVSFTRISISSAMSLGFLKRYRLPSIWL